MGIILFSDRINRIQPSLTLKMTSKAGELRAKGFDVINVGTDTPLKKIKTLFKESNPDRLYISSTVAKDPKSVESDVVKLFVLANSYNTLVFLGGRGFEHVRLPVNGNYKILSSFSELAESSQ